jgi:hypothetical protein
MLLYTILILLAAPLIILSIQSVLIHWRETEGLFTMIYLCLILGMIIGWYLTNVAHIYVFEYL